MKSSSLTDKIDAAIRVFLYILIFWLPYGPAVIEICVVICVILWLVKRVVLLIKREEGYLKEIRPADTFLNRPIMFFLFACFLSVAGSAFFAQSLHNFLTKTIEWFVVYFLIVEVVKEKKHIYIMLSIFMFTAFSTVIDSLIQFYITNKDIFSGHIIEPHSRATAGFKTSNGLGGYLTVVIPFLAVWGLWGKQKLPLRVATFVFLILAVWSVVITFSRGAWLGVAFGTLLFLTLQYGKEFSFRFTAKHFWVGIIFCFSLIWFLANRFEPVLLERYETIPWRLSIWVNSLEIIKDKFFFGHGINTFMRIFQAYRPRFFTGPTYAHNCYVQLAVETGVVGLACFLWIIVELFRRSVQEFNAPSGSDQNSKILALGLLSGIFAILVHSFFDTHFYSLQHSVYIWFMVGLLVAISRNSNRQITGSI